MADLRKEFLSFTKMYQLNKTMRAIINTLIFVLFTALASSQEANLQFKLADQEIQLAYKKDLVDIEYKIREEQKGVEIATLKLKYKKKISPQELSVKWSTPSSNVAGYWSTHASFDKTITPDWGPAKVQSMLARESPVISLFGHNDMNRQTFAVSEVLNTVVTSTAVKEENGMIYNEFKLFTEKHRRLTYYQIELRLDTRTVPYAEALQEVADWWANFELYKPATVPEAARLPVYSSWYSYHQNVSMDALLKECQVAKEIGFETIIVDDGWQTLDSNRGYAYTGDWKPDRIPEMKAFVQAVHDLGMKFILWYAVPFVGEKSEAYHQMKGKFLTYWEGQGTYVLDPRFPEVRAFIIGTYVKALKEWDLDGFKLDFLGRFRANENTKLVKEGGRDYASVNEATDRLMTDLMQALKEVKEDVMIEFRQPYTGPAMRKYGNMFRATDCPNVAIMNRIGTTDLRLLSGETVVHSDMLMWHYDEDVEQAALQLLNVLFSVPQISVRLEEIPKDHFEMIRFYTQYWLRNRAIFLDGSFAPSSPQQNYPLIQGSTVDKSITVVFNDLFVPLETDAGVAVDIVNAKASKRIIVDVVGKKRYYQCKIMDCQGKEISEEVIELQEGVRGFDVPASGLITLIPQ